MPRPQQAKLQYAYEDGRCGGRTPGDILAEWHADRAARRCELCLDAHHRWPLRPSLLGHKMTCMHGQQQHCNFSFFIDHLGIAECFRSI